MNIVIRQEKEEDFNSIYNLVKIAFETAKVSNGKEQDYVDLLRRGSSYIPELALAAVDDEELVGHIMLTGTYVMCAETKVETLLLAPLSVSLVYRNRGVGSRLIYEAFRLAKEAGHNSVFLVGDPGYYHRFGFRASVDFGITNSYSIPNEYVMGCELIPNSLLGITGEITWQ